MNNEPETEHVDPDDFKRVLVSMLQALRLFSREFDDKEPRFAALGHFLILAGAAVSYAIAEIERIEKEDA